MSPINPAVTRSAAGWPGGRPEDCGLIDAALEPAVGNGTVLGVAAMGGTSKGLGYEGFGRLATQLYDAITSRGLDVDTVAGGHQSIDGKTWAHAAPLAYLKTAAG